MAAAQPEGWESRGTWGGACDWGRDRLGADCVGEFLFFLADGGHQFRDFRDLRDIRDFPSDRDRGEDVRYHTDGREERPKKKSQQIIVLLLFFLVVGEDTL